MRYEYGFIGTGNMGSALSTGVVKKVDAASVAVCDHSAEKAQASPTISASKSPLVRTLRRTATLSFSL